jgi:hypothetical protein
LALIATLRRTRRNGAVIRFVCKVVELASALLLQYTRGNKEALICSELVYRSYVEAIKGYGDPYNIIIRRRESESSLMNKSLGYQDEFYSRESFFGLFYGSSFNMLHLKSGAASFLNTNSLSLIPKDIDIEYELGKGELEELFEEVEKSYLEENYDFSIEELAPLKSAMDGFIISTYANFKSIP